MQYISVCCLVWVNRFFKAVQLEVTILASQVSLSQLSFLNNLRLDQLSMLNLSHQKSLSSLILQESQYFIGPCPAAQAGTACYTCFLA